MHTLYEKILDQRKEAVLVATVESKVVKAALDSVITKLEVAQKSPQQRNKALTDQQVLDVLSATSREYEKSIQAFSSAEELATSDKAKLDCRHKIQLIRAEQNVVKLYLPEQMSEAKIHTHIKNIIDTMKLDDVKKAGVAVGFFNKQFPKQADGKVVLLIAQNILSN